MTYIHDCVENRQAMRTTGWRRLYSGLWWPSGKEIWKRRAMCACMADEPCCTTETNTALYSKYMPIKNKRKPKRHVTQLLPLTVELQSKTGWPYSPESAIEELHKMLELLLVERVQDPSQLPLAPPFSLCDQLTLSLAVQMHYLPSCLSERTCFL